MTTTILDSPSVWAQMGGNLGKTLSEQIPQVVQQYRLSNALKGIQDKTPTEQIQSILAGGGSLQDYASLAPVLQRLQSSKAASERATEESKERISVPQEQGVGRLSSGGASVLPMSPVEEDAAAKKLQMQYPSLYTDFSQYVKDIHDRRQQEIEGQKALETEKQNIAGEYNALLNKQLQVKDLSEAYTKISGITQTERLNEIYKDLDAGMTKKQALEKAAKKDVSLSRTSQDFANMGNVVSFDKRPSKQKATIENIREVYKDSDLLPEFRSKLISDHGLSRGPASEITYPLSNNKEIKDKIDSYTKPQGFRGKREGAEKMASFILQNIKPGDSITSMLYAFEKKHYNTADLQSQLRLQAKEDDLNERQKEELLQPLSGIPTYGDIYARTFW